MKQYIEVIERSTGIAQERYDATGKSERYISQCIQGIEINLHNEFEVKLNIEESK